MEISLKENKRKGTEDNKRDADFKSTAEIAIVLNFQIYLHKFIAKAKILVDNVG